MANLALLHARLLFTILLFFGALSLWGLFSALRRSGVTGSYRGALAVGELLMLAEFVLGVIVFVSGGGPYRPSIHILYGVVAIITLPATFAYTRGRDGRTEQLIYALTCLFLCGIALRGLETGRLPG
jgi:hypothetical protein